MDYNLSEKNLQKRVCAYNSIKFPCQTQKKLFFLQISGDKAEIISKKSNKMRISEILVAGVGFEPTTFRL